MMHEELSNIRAQLKQSIQLMEELLSGNEITENEMLYILNTLGDAEISIDELEDAYLVATEELNGW